MARFTSARLRPVSFVFGALALGTMAVGVGYTQWSKTITGTTNASTGTVNVQVTAASTDDDGTHNDPTDMWRHNSSTGLNGYPHESGGAAEPQRLTVNIGTCEAQATNGGDGVRTTITNAYPGYTCTTTTTFKNTGSLPVKITDGSLTIKKNGVDLTQGTATDKWSGSSTVPAASLNGAHVLNFDAAAQGFYCLNPGQSVQAKGWVQVQDGAEQGATYVMESTAQFDIKTDGPCS